MILKLQIITSLLSLGFGLFYYLMLKLNSKFLYNSKYNLIINILFTCDNVLLYFILLKKINNGLFHPYLLITIILGFILGWYIDKVWTKWYNQHRRK